MMYPSVNAGPASVGFEGRRVLVTGGCGFIGSHLVEQLVARGAAVWVLDNLQAGTPNNLSLVRNQVDLVIGDVRDTGCVKRVIELSRPAYVFHLAANASVPGSVENPAYDFETNSAGTFALFEALRGYGRCEKVVLASSGAVYGQPQNFPIVEEQLWDPISPYGASKVCAETIARMFQRVYDLPVVAARIFNTYGPRMARFVVLDFLRKLQRNPDALEVLGNGQQVRDFTFVSDTVQGLLVLAEHGLTSEAYNLSSGCSVSVTEVAQMLIAALGLTGRTRITYTGSSWPGDAQRWVVSIEKLRRLGYIPTIDLENGLARTIKWYQAQTQEEVAAASSLST
jgi:UDP-glucose 4-epimerase